MPNLSGSAGATSSAAAMSDSGSNAKCLANNASTPKLCATTIQGLRPDRASVDRCAQPIGPHQACPSRAA